MVDKHPPYDGPVADQPSERPAAPPGSLAAELPPLPPRWSAPLSSPARLPVLPTADEVRGLSAADAAALAQRMNGPTCDHGSPVKDESPSAFEGGEPVREYEDGCSSVGPYQPLSEITFRSDT